MRTFHFMVIVAFMAAVAAAANVSADTSFRCGNDIIGLGYLMHQVRSECGDPISEQRVGEKTTYDVLDGGTLKVKDVLYVTEWIYERDGGMYILTFEGGRLTNKEFRR